MISRMDYLDLITEGQLEPTGEFKGKYLGFRIPMYQGESSTSLSQCLSLEAIRLSWRLSADFRETPPAWSLL
jgi:hypothetical protein